MKKIIAAFDSLKFCETTLHYAVEIARQHHAFLVGVFTNEFSYQSQQLSEVLAEEGISKRVLGEVSDEDEERRDNATATFSAACQRAKIDFSIHENGNKALAELLHESLYADLLIIDKIESFTLAEQQVPSTFIQDLLSEVQCPVLVVPECYHPVEKIVFLYDGTPSAVYALKMFSYLLPVMKEIKIEVLNVQSKKGLMYIPGKRLIREFMKMHFRSADFIVLKGVAEEEIIRYLRQQKENMLLVLGAYDRGKVSRWFKPSMADVLMNASSSPLFIAHIK